MGVILSKPEVNPWHLFTGNDLCYPVEMFIHIMEYKFSLEELGTDEKMALNILSHIPDTREVTKDDSDISANNCPAAIWKSKVNKKNGLKWSEIKLDLLEEFGSKAEYTLKEKLHLLKSIRKGAYEESQAYLIRIRCIVSILVNNKIYSNLDDLPSPSDIWVRVLFLFGLDEMEQVL